jgi:hypothetical protein
MSSLITYLLETPDLTPADVKSFIKTNKVDVNFENEDGETALLVMVEERMPTDFMQVLAKAGFIMTGEAGALALLVACEEKPLDFGTTRFLIDQGCPVSEAFPKFVEAIEHNELDSDVEYAAEIAELMLAKDADVEETYNDNGDTIFMLAKNVKIMKVLLAHAWNKKKLLEVENDDGETALSLAEHNGYHDIVELLEELSVAEDTTEAEEVEEEASDDEYESDEEESDGDEEEESDNSDDDDDEPKTRGRKPAAKPAPKRKTPTKGSASVAAPPPSVAVAPAQSEPGVMIARLWSKESTIEELKELLKRLYGFTDYDKLKWKGKRKDTMIEKLEELEADALKSGAAAAAVAK